jgi:hypothetical protein
MENPKWKQIADGMKQRFLSKKSPKIVRERWFNHLNPNLSKGDWKTAEEIKLIEAIEMLGPRWSRVCRQVQGRTEHSVKNRYKSLIKAHAKNSADDSFAT